MSDTCTFLSSIRNKMCSWTLIFLKKNQNFGLILNTSISMKGTRAIPSQRSKWFSLPTFMYSCKHKQQYKYFNNKKTFKTSIYLLLFWFVMHRIHKEHAFEIKQLWFHMISNKRHKYNVIEKRFVLSAQLILETYIIPKKIQYYPG